MKKGIIAVIVIFVVWSILDMVLHGVILGSTYQQTAELWRPKGEMMMWLIHVCTLVSAIVFVTIYARLIQPKSMKNALTFAALFGLVAGFSMGYGTYSSMPVPHCLAITWFVGTFVEFMVAGALLGWIIKE